jgi:hypothetical protein
VTHEDELEELRTIAFERLETIRELRYMLEDRAAEIGRLGSVIAELKAAADQPHHTLTTDEAVVRILDAIKAIREQAADERVAMHERGEPLTDYSGGVLDGLDRAWLAGTKAARRPEDNRTATSPEEWWACEDAYELGLAAADARDTNTRAAAWDEGWNAAMDYASADYTGPDDPPNPYAVLDQPTNTGDPT